VMLVGSVAILVFTGGGLVFYGAAFASFGVVGKGWNDLGQAKQAIRLYQQDRVG
jgi:hypothetical protein